MPDGAERSSQSVSSPPVATNGASAQLPNSCLLAALQRDFVPWHFSDAGGHYARPRPSWTPASEKPAQSTEAESREGR